jgi:hypothetical protein
MLNVLPRGAQQALATRKLSLVLGGRAHQVIHDIDGPTKFARARILRHSALLGTRVRHQRQ